MAISRPNASAETKRAFLAGIEDFLGSGDPTAGRIRSGTLPTESLQVFTLTLGDVLDGGDTSAAKPAGWRFVTTGLEEVLASDVIQVPEERSERMNSLSRDPRLGPVIQFMHRIPELPEVQRGGDYELRLLRIPAVLVDAFWLKSMTDAGDLIIPVLSAAKELRTLQVYAVKEFFTIAGSLARSFREFDEKVE